MKYIDADKLIAKIHPLYEEAKDNSRFSDTSSDYSKWRKAEWVYEHVLHLITSLQHGQLEVDLEKELDLWMKSNQDDAGYYNTLKLVEHFFELGLKAQKGE